MSQLVHHHCGSAIIVNSGNNQLLIGEYDQGYPRISERGKANFIGGNYCFGDQSPQHTFEREINEEFTLTIDSGDLDKIVEDLSESESISVQRGSFARADERDYIRKSILERAEPYRDFLITLSDKAGQPIDVAHSIFKVVLPTDCFNLVTQLLNDGRRLTQEGLLRVLDFEDITSGRILAAYGAGPILVHYLEKQLPWYQNIPIEPMSFPFSSYKDYEKIFEYTHHPKQ